MDLYYGFDLGDAESAVARLEKDADKEPQIIKVRGAQSFITAYALKRGGEMLIGESACYEPEAVRRKIRVKSRFLTDRSAREDVKSCAAGVLGELYAGGDLIRGQECCFYVGCPAGWDKMAREDYREIFERIGYPPLRIISESRAALVAACQSRHLQIGHDILSKPVLVVDIGSSTTDFAYISGGREVELKTAGEVTLGGGVMDEILLEECVKASTQEERIRQIFEESSAWQSYCEFAARRLKETYYAEEDYWKENECIQSVTIRYDESPIRLLLSMDEWMADKLVNGPSRRLSGRSFSQVFKQSLAQVRESITGEQPELIFLTGGVSRLAQIRDWCHEAFPQAVIICSAEPEFSVAKGLADCGRIDEQLRLFREDLGRLIESTTVETIVEENIDLLYKSTVEAAADPIIEEVALPIIDRWRDGEIDRLADIDPIMEEEIEAFLQSREGRIILSGVVSKWLRKIAGQLEEKTMPICAKHNVPYSALNLSTYLSLADMDIHVDAKDLFAVEEITWLIDAVVSVVVGLLCGGSGVALISSGIQGILIGAVVSILVLALGRDYMQEVLLKMHVPRPMRKLMPRSAIRSRADRITREVKEDLIRKLETEKNEQITQQLVSEISEQIESCLIKMAEVVEIPLG